MYVIMSFLSYDFLILGENAMRNGGEYNMSLSNWRKRGIIWST